MKNLSFVLFVLALAGLFSIYACGDSSNADKSKKEVNEAVNAVGDELESEKNELKREISDAQSNIDRRLEKLNNDLKTANAQAKADIQKEIDKLEAKRKQLAQDLENFGDKAGAEWSQFKANVRATLKDIGEDKQ